MADFEFFKKEFEFKGKHASSSEEFTLITLVNPDILCKDGTGIVGER